MWGNLTSQAVALPALQETVEAYVVNLFDGANLCAIHGKCISVMQKDTQLAQRIQGDVVKYLPRKRKKNNLYIKYM